VSYEEEKEEAVQLCVRRRIHVCRRRKKRQSNYELKNKQSNYEQTSAGTTRMAWSPNPKP
jgi:hypothetical protein